MQGTVDSTTGPAFADQYETRCKSTQRKRPGGLPTHRVRSFDALCYRILVVLYERACPIRSILDDGQTVFFRQIMVISPTVVQSQSRHLAKNQLFTPRGFPSSHSGQSLEEGKDRRGMAPLSAEQGWPPSKSGAELRQ